MEANKQPRHAKTESGKRLSRLMAQSYMDLHRRAGEGAFVVWAAIIVPVEIFAGFRNVIFAVPESHAAMSAGKGVGPLQCEKAERLGYSMDLCSYARIDIGTHFDGGKDSPTWGLPKPHLLVSNTNNCSLLVKWFDVFRREWEVPHLVLDVPFAYGPQRPGDLDYILGQFQVLIETIEKMTGERFDIDAVREAVKNSREASRHWKRFLSHAAHRPSGITAFDSFVQMAPTLTERGKPELAEHYRLLADETTELLKAGAFPVADENYRLLWDNIAPWHQLKNMSSRLASLGANIIAASYTYCLGTVEGEYRLFEGETEDPLRYLARIQNFSVCPMGKELRKKAMTEAIRDLGIDGAVFASNRSCKVYSVMQMDMMNEIAEECGIPCVMIDVDHADARRYSEEGAFTRIEALLERIDAVRNGRDRSQPKLNGTVATVPNTEAHMQNEITSPMELLDPRGHITEEGWARHPYWRYDRSAIRAPWYRIKEWDYFSILSRDGRYGLGLTAADLGFLGIFAICWLDLDRGYSHQVDTMTLMPRGKTGLNPDSDTGGVSFSDRKLSMDFSYHAGRRVLRFSAPELRDARGEQGLEGEIILTQPEGIESMTIATSWKEDRRRFYYNRKINCLPASGSVRIGKNEYSFRPDSDFGALDWGRGAWTYRNRWYWGSASGLVEGKPFGFNIGYGFTDRTPASENMLFYEGRAHKLEEITFHIDTSDYMKPWKFTSSDGRFEMDFKPLVDRAQKLNLLLAKTDQHQTFGLFSGRAILDGGKEIILKDFLGFAEDVLNWM